MPVFLLIIGALCLVIGVRGNTDYTIALLKEDLLGDHGFVMWTLAVIIVVSLGHIKTIRPATDAFLGLIILVIIVYTYKNNTNLFQSFAQQLQDGVSQNGNCGTTPQANISGGGGGAASTALQVGQAFAATGGL